MSFFESKEALMRRHELTDEQFKKIEYILQDEKNMSVLLRKHMIAIKFLTLLHGWKQLLLYLLNQIEPINAAMINIIIKIVI